MLSVIMGVALIFFAASQIGEESVQPPNTIHYWHPTLSGPVYEENLTVKPLPEFLYANIVRQAYDYSCGSAALTTILNHYLGRQFEERQIMEGLLRFGETDKIVDRKGFSLLDMKRLVTALGHPSGGFKATFEDIKELDHPAIVPIGYAGFKHFVVLKAYKDGHVFVADPSIGNISFSEERFQDVWQGYREDGSGVLFIVFPNGFQPGDDLALSENDLRIVTEKTISYLSFREFPLFNDEFIETAADRAGSLVKVQITSGEFDTAAAFLSFLETAGGAVIKEQDDGTLIGEYATPTRMYFRH